MIDIFPGVAPPVQVLFSVSLVVVAAMFGWTVVLFVRSGRATRKAPQPDPALTDQFLWIFLVPALNEAITIKDSVERLLAIPVLHRRIIVIDDGSDDGTDTVLAEFDARDLTVIRRNPPEARLGKASALNQAYRSLDPYLGDFDRDRAIVVIVDADGRLHPEAPSYMASHFAADPQVGGVQSLVRIYNRTNPLTWMQNVEFAVYGHLYQAGRNDWGTAGMGGNGQFNRLSALDDLANQEGPWRERLTEDQDLGLRLISTGWKNRQDVRALIEQQGLPRLLPLLRQRTRWFQGGLQALDLARPVLRSPTPLGARIEMFLYLLMPFWQGIVGAALVAALVLAITEQVPVWGGGPIWPLVLVYLLAFGGTVLSCLAARRRDGPWGWLVALVMGHVYALYTWLIWPVLIRATARQLTRRSTWAKTAREPIDSGQGAMPLLPGGETELSDLEPKVRGERRTGRKNLRKA